LTFVNGDNFNGGRAHERGDQFMSTTAFCAACFALLTISLVYFAVVLVNSSHRVDQMLADVASATRTDETARIDS
jgi:hypothetical protein